MKRYRSRSAARTTKSSVEGTGSVHSKSALAKEAAKKLTIRLRPHQWQWLQRTFWNEDRSACGAIRRLIDNDIKKFDDYLDYLDSLDYLAESERASRERGEDDADLPWF